MKAMDIINAGKDFVCNLGKDTIIATGITVGSLAAAGLVLAFVGRYHLTDDIPSEETIIVPEEDIEVVPFDGEEKEED